MGKALFKIYMFNLPEWIEYTVLDPAWRIESARLDPISRMDENMSRSSTRNTTKSSRIIWTAENKVNNKLKYEEKKFIIIHSNPDPRSILQNYDSDPDLAY